MSAKKPPPFEAELIFLIVLAVVIAACYFGLGIVRRTVLP